MYERMNVREIAIAGLLTAIVFVATYAVQIPLPGIATGGLIHLGNVALFTIAVVLGKKYGAISGAFGMALFDVLSPWVIWAPGTFVIRGVMGYMVGAIANGGKEENPGLKRLTLAMMLPSIWMILGYFSYNILLYHDARAALLSIPGDVIQIAAGMILAMPTIVLIQKSGSASRLRQMAFCKR